MPRARCVRITGSSLGTMTRPINSDEFAKALKSGKFDLLVYSSQFTDKEQPYDGLLSQLLCSRNKPLTIISDDRETARCACDSPVRRGVARGAVQLYGHRGKDLGGAGDAALQAILTMR